MWLSHQTDGSISVSGFSWFSIHQFSHSNTASNNFEYVCRLWKQILLERNSMCPPRLGNILFFYSNHNHFFSRNWLRWLWWLHRVLHAAFMPIDGYVRLMFRQLLHSQTFFLNIGERFYWIEYILASNNYHFCF